MWPFKKKVEPAAASRPSDAVPQVHFDWKGVPTIQRTAGSHPLTIPTRPFAAGLVTHADPRAVAEPLGHQVSLEAPPGIVLGIARPQPRTAGPELVPLQRSMRRSSVQRVSEQSADDLAVAPVQELDAEAPKSSEASRRLPVVPAAPAVQLTRVSEATEPQPLPLAREIVVERQEQPVEEQAQSEPIHEATTELPSFPRLTIGQARRLGLGAPIARVPDSARSMQRSAEATISTPSPPASDDVPQFAPHPLDRLITRRPEKAAPTPISRPQRIPDSPVVARTPMTEPAIEEKGEPATESIDADASTGGTLQSAPEPTALQRLEQTDGNGERDAAPPVHAPEAPMAELAGSTPMISHPALTGTTLAAAARGEAMESTAEPLPSLPLAAAPGVQRNVEAEPARASDAPSSEEPPPELANETEDAADASIQRAPEEGAPLISGRRPETNGDTAGISNIQRVDVSPSEAAPLPIARPAGRPSLQRMIDGGSPLILSTPTVDRPLAGRLPMVQRMADRQSMAAEPRGSRATSIVPSPVSAFASPVSAFALSGYGGSVQRLELTSLPRHTQESSAALTLAPPVQRAGWAESPGDPEPDASVGSAPVESDAGWGGVAPVQRAAIQEWSVQTAPPLAAAPAVAEAPAPASAGAAAGEEHLDELAAKLYDKIRVQLRNELLVDRERAGLFTDLR